MEAQYGKFLDMICAVRINVSLVNVLAEMSNYEIFFKELVNNKHKIKQIYAAFLSDESSAILQNKVPPKLGDPGSFLIPCNFNKAFSCNALADLDASINLIPYSLYAKLSLETLKPTKMSVRLANRSFQYPVGIGENMLVEVGSEILHSIEGTILKEKLFAEFDEFMAMTADENSKSESDTKEPPFKKITFNTDYKIKTSLEEPLMDLELKPLPDNLEYIFLEEPSFFLCLLAIFHDMIEESVKNCEDAHLVLNREKCHFMVKEGIMLGHKVSEAGFKVDKAKINVIFELPPPTNIKGTENVATDHLSGIEKEETSDDSEVNDNFPRETLMEINTEDDPWFTDFINYLVSDIIPKGMTYQQKNKFFSDIKNFFWEEPYLFKVHLKTSRAQINKELASPEQTASGQTTTGKESSNPFMAGSLPKTIHFCDSLQSDEDSFKLIEFMILCTNFLTVVCDLENLKNHLSDNEESLGEDASKQGRMDDSDSEVTFIDKTSNDARNKNNKISNSN
ncbi:reverse transcriptase domain-containing protein [Tanacetum coccineum]